MRRESGMSMDGKAGRVVRAGPRVAGKKRGAD